MVGQLTAKVVLQYSNAFFLFIFTQEVTEEKTNTHICRGMPQPSPTVRQQPAPHLQQPQQYQPQQQPAPHLQQQQQYPLQQQRMMGAHEMTDEEVTYVRACVCACVCVCVCVCARASKHKQFRMDR
jgi:hypothetical protein